MSRFALAVLLSTALTSPVLAQMASGPATPADEKAPASDVPKPIADSDPRVRQVEYDPTKVIRIIVPAGGETDLVFHPDETGFDAALPSNAWRKDSAANTIAVAPSPGAPPTDMHIVGYMQDGTRHRYTLELIPSDQDATKAGAYATVQFLYTAEDKARADKARADAAAVAAESARQAAKAPRAAWLERHPRPPRDAKARALLAAAVQQQPRRCDFMWRGSAALLPVAACDTGSQTTFLWPGQMPVPAIFLVNADGTEEAVTQSPSPARPGLVVVPTTSQWLRLRSGKLVADLYDAAYNPIGQDYGTGTILPNVRAQVRVDAQ